jgi:hypothetical protein
MMERQAWGKGCGHRFTEEEEKERGNSATGNTKETLR